MAGPWEAYQQGPWTAYQPAPPVVAEPTPEPLPVAQGLMMRARSGIGQAVGGAQQMFGEQVGQLVDAGMAPFQTVHEAVTGTSLPNPVGRGLEESAAQGAAVAEQARLESQDAQQGVTAPDSVAAAFGNPGNALRYYGGLMAESAPTMAAAMATRNPGLATALTGAATTGQTYSAERAEGASPWEAAQTAAVSGGMEAGLGLVPFEKALGAGSLPRRMATTALSEGTTEAITGAGQKIATDAMKGQDTSRADINRVAIDSAIVGTGMGVGEAVLGSGRPAQRPPPRNPVEAGAYAAEDSLAEARARRAGPVAPTPAAPATAAPAAELDTEIDAGLAPPALAPKESPVAKKAATYDRLATEADAAGNSTLAAQYRQSAAVLRSRENPDARVSSGGSENPADFVGNRGTFRENAPILGVGERADGNGAAPNIEEVARERNGPVEQRGLRTDAREGIRSAAIDKVGGASGPLAPPEPSAAANQGQSRETHEVGGGPSAFQTGRDSQLPPTDSDAAQPSEVGDGIRTLAGRADNQAASVTERDASEARPVPLAPDAMARRKPTQVAAIDGAPPALRAQPSEVDARAAAQPAKADPPEGATLRQRWQSDFDTVANEYAALSGEFDSKGGRVLNTDLARELSPEYRADRTKSANVHESASDFVKALYAQKLSQPTPAGLDPVVLLTAGGTGAGKTTGEKKMAAAGALGAPEITYDTNMNKLESSVQKIEQALAAGREVNILYTYRDPVDALVKGALPRAARMEREHGTGRTVPLAEHEKTHVGAYKTIQALRDKYATDPRVGFTVIDNSRGKGGEEIVPFDALPQLEDNSNYGRPDQQIPIQPASGNQGAPRLVERLREALDAEYAAGNISEAVYRGFGGKPPPVQRESVTPKAPAKAGVRTSGEPTSWVLRNKETGEVIAETFDRKKVDALNTAKYEAVPIKEYLAGLNAPRKEGERWGDRDKPLKSETPAPATVSASAKRVRRQVESQFAGYENAPKIEVWDSAADMPEGKSRLTALDSEDDGNGVEGLYDPDTNTVHLFANRLPTGRRALWVAIHEIIGHAGMRGYIKSNGKGKGSLARTLKQARSHPTIADLTRAIASDRDLDGNEDLATEEALAELAAADTTNDWQHIADRYGVEVPKRMRSGVRAAIARFIESIKSLFRTIDPATESFTDADWRKLVEGARRYVREGIASKATTVADSAPLKSTAPKSQTDTPAFKAWFGDSKVVDAEGRPLVVYHGTNADFDAFNTDRSKVWSPDEVGSFFSSSRAAVRGYGGRVVAAYLSIQNPHVVSVEQWETEGGAITPRQAREAGHDGYVITGQDGGDSYIAFRPEQIKSATGNAGTFDPNEPSILKSVAPKGMKERVSTLAEKFERDWLDEYADLTAAEKATADKLGRPLPESMQARRAENLRHGRFQDQLQRALAEYFEPVAEMLGAAKLSREGFADYLWWRHAPERDAYLRAKDGTNAAADGLAGISPKEAKANIAALPATEREVYERAAKKIDALRKFTLDKLVDSGQIAEEVRDGLMNRWKFYVPLRGMPAGTDDPELGVGGAGKGLSVARNPLGKQAMGRKSKPSDILEQMKQDLERALIGAEKQRVVHRVEHLVMNNPDLGEVEPVDYEKKEVNGVIQYVQTRGDTREQLVYLHEGVPVRIKLADPMLTQALLNMNEPMWVGLRHLAKATRWLSAVKTSLSPYFMLINPVRDAQMAAMGVTAEQGVKVAKTAAAYYLQTYGALRRDRKGAAKDRPIDRYAREFAAAGGKTGYTLLNNIKDIQRDLSRLFAEHDTRKSARVLARRAWIKAGDLVEHANDLAENSTRLAVYSAMRDHGKSVEEAAKYAKDVTVNFNVRGRLGKQMTSAYMFFNAAIQGSARLTRLIKNPIFAGTMTGMVALSYALTLAQMMAMGDDDDGESKYLKLIKDHDRQRAIPFAIDDEKFFSMPMAYGPNMFTYLGSKMAEVQYELMQGRTVKPGKIAGQLFDNFASSMSPIQVNRGAYALLPEVARVPVQLKANVDDFGNPINYAEKFQRVEDDPLFDDGNATTGAAYEQFARALNAVTGGSDYDAGKVNLAPEHVRYVAEQGLGGLLRLATESYELAEKTILGIPLEAQDVPLSNVYVKSRPEDRQQSENYYENREDIEKARAVWKKAIARQDEAKQAELLEQHPWLQGSELSGNTREGRAAQAGTVLKALRDAERNIKALRDERESAYLGTGDYEGLGRRDRVMKAREIDGRIAKWQKWLNARQNGRELPMPE